MEIDWEIRKAESNYKKHGVRFSECFAVFEDNYAITVIDQESEPGETRFVTIGIGVKGQVLVVVYTYRGAEIRIVSSRLAEPRERSQYEERR
jgi:uncharacterized DUF497 family protein